MCDAGSRREMSLAAHRPKLANGEISASARFTANMQIEKRRPVPLHYIRFRSETGARTCPAH